MQHGLRTIAFCRSRKCSELVATYTREALKASAPHLASSFKVRGLRGCRGGLGLGARRQRRQAFQGSVPDP